jgi:integrase/recombinase XerD
VKLQQAVEAYLSHKRSLGMQCKTIERNLRAFCKGIGDVGANDVRDEAVRAYIYGSGPVTTNLHVKFDVLRGFYRYLLTRGYVARRDQQNALTDRTPQRYIKRKLPLP